jgi:ABC-type transport system involved in multi-copper enzyme maturation permease subunit
MTRPSVWWGVAAVAGAEWRKLWDSRIPALVLALLPVGTWLFAAQLYHVEGMSRRLAGPGAFVALPVLFFAVWKTLLFQASMLAFAAFWTTVDSQYGMIRVAACQPITRVEYLAGKWLAIAAHVGLCTAAFVCWVVGWAVVYSGVHGMSLAQWAAIGRFAAEVMVFTVTLALVAAAAASLRRTVGAGLITAAMSVIGLAFMTMLPFDFVSPDWVLMRYFTFPLGELPNPFPGETDSPFVRVHSVGQFLRAAAATVLAFVLPALVYYQRRDITE